MTASPMEPRTTSAGVGRGCRTSFIATAALLLGHQVTLGSAAQLTPPQSTSTAKRASATQAQRSSGHQHDGGGGHLGRRHYNPQSPVASETTEHLAVVVEAQKVSLEGTRNGLSFWHEREQLASAFRALAAAGLSAASGLGNHLTLSVGPDYTRFLLSRYGLHWMEVTAENLVLVDANGTIIEGEGPVQGAAVALHGPVHAARKEKARVIFHTHQPWFTALACIKAGGLRMFHPDACIYADRVGFDPVYTGNWPMGSLLGSMSEGERLLRVPELKGKDLCFLANHGTLQISGSIEEALFDCFNLERLCKEQVHAMMYASPFRELQPDQIASLHTKYEAMRASTVSNYYEKHVRQNYATQPISGAWNGKGDVPLTFGVYSAHAHRSSTAEYNPDGQVVASRRPSFMEHTVPAHEWEVRVDMAAVCRLISRLNGHTTYEGSFAHFSYDLGDGTYLTAPADIPFAAMRASSILVCDEHGTVLRGEGHVDTERFRAFNRMRHAGQRPYPMLLFTHTTFTDRLSQHGERLRMISQTAFNFAEDWCADFDAWGHDLDPSSDFTSRLVDHFVTDDKVLVMLSHGGCIARGESAAHVFALIHGVDAAAEIQVYGTGHPQPQPVLDLVPFSVSPLGFPLTFPTWPLACAPLPAASMTGFPLMELPEDRVKAFPRHGYGDMRGTTKRMVQAFAANKRLLLVDWNQGFRNTGDSVFAL